MCQDVALWLCANLCFCDFLRTNRSMHLESWQPFFSFLFFQFRCMLCQTVQHSKSVCRTECVQNCARHAYTQISVNVLRKHLWMINWCFHRTDRFCLLADWLTLVCLSYLFRLLFLIALLLLSEFSTSCAVILEWEQSKYFWNSDVLFLIVL